MSEHTPGPWDLEMPREGSKCAYIWDRPETTGEEFEAGVRRILITTFVIANETDRANLRLIMAAPELLAALIEIRDKRHSKTFTVAHAAEIARAAISKATEESHE